jgi:hypothetical protein
MDIRMDKIVVFKSNTPTTKGAGSADSYSTLCTTRGRLKKSSSVRTLSAGEMSFDGTYELIVRYQDTIHNAIRNDLKILIDSVTYTIQSWEKMREKRFYLKFTISGS